MEQEAPRASSASAKWIFLVLIVLLALCGISWFAGGETMRMRPSPDEIRPFSEGLAPVGLNRKWDYVDVQGRYVTRQSFDYAGPFAEGLAAVNFGGRWLGDDVPQFRGGKWGYIDTKGNMVIAPSKFDLVHPFSGGMARVEQSGRFGFVDRSGKVVVPIEYEFAEDFSEGLACVSRTGETGTFGFVDATGKFVISPGLDYAFSFHNGRARVPRTGYIDQKGDVVIAKGQFESLSDFSEGLAAVAINNVWGFIDTSGKVVIPPRWPMKPRGFSEGLCAVYDGKWGFIDKRGKLVITSRFDRVGNFHEGLASVAVGKGTNQWGYVNQQAEFVIAPKFIYAEDFNSGRATVTIKDKQGVKTCYINKAGNVVWKPDYE